MKISAAQTRPVTSDGQHDIIRRGRFVEQAATHRQIMICLCLDPFDGSD